jgi:hypothetical protein
MNKIKNISLIVIILACACHSQIGFQLSLGYLNILNTGSYPFSNKNNLKYIYFKFPATVKVEIYKYFNLIQKDGILNSIGLICYFSPSLYEKWKDSVNFVFNYKEFGIWSDTRLNLFQKDKLCFNGNIELGPSFFSKPSPSEPDPDPDISFKIPEPYLHLGLGLQIKYKISNKSFLVLSEIFNQIVTLHSSKVFPFFNNFITSIGLDILIN